MPAAVKKTTKAKTVKPKKTTTKKTSTAPKRKDRACGPCKPKPKKATTKTTTRKSYCSSTRCYDYSSSSDYSDSSDECYDCCSRRSGCRR